MTSTATKGLTQSHIQVAGHLMHVAGRVGAHVPYMTVSDTNSITLIVDDPSARAALAAELGLTYRATYPLSDGRTVERFEGTQTGVDVTVFGDVVA